MTLFLVMLTLAFTAFTLYKTVAPFITSRHGQVRFELLDEELREIELLVAKKAALLQGLRDIEYDWDTDKVAEADYLRFKASYERQAIGVMRRLDAIHGGRQWEAQIDEELARRLGQSQPDTKTVDQPVDPPAANADDLDERLDFLGANPTDLRNERTG
ncbi:MAG: hypothetical protein H0U74_06430 [Bradymonadaceae bacterium]|nr:hypothetical protein [Lujinxingiaceae bacterium]